MEDPDLDDRVHELTEALVLFVDKIVALVRVSGDVEQRRMMAQADLRSAAERIALRLVGVRNWPPRA